ncbi:hypothetical protein ACA910_009219 [Epithemia clementina (nom. ined.)]
MRSSWRLLAPLPSLQTTAANKQRLKATAAATADAINEKVSNLIKHQRLEKTTGTTAGGAASATAPVSSGAVSPSAPSPSSTSKNEGTMSLNKYMAHKGLCSRREADKYLEKGWVLLNGIIPTKEQSMTRIDPNDPNLVVELTSKAAMDQAQRCTILLHKPLGVVSCQPESKEQTPAVTLLTADRQYHGTNYRNHAHSSSSSSSPPPSRQHGNNNNENNWKDNPRKQKGWAVAGRLDVNSSGLLILTQSGKVARELIRPNGDVEKEYLVRIPLVRDLDHKIELLRQGIYEKFSTTPPSTSSSSTMSRESMTSRSPPWSRYGQYDDDDDNEEDDTTPNQTQQRDPKQQQQQQQHQQQQNRDGVWLRAKVVEQINDNQLRFVLTTGITHQIRRMCDAVALPIQSIKRVRMGKIVLGDLPLGKWKYLPPGFKLV